MVTWKEKKLGDIAEIRMCKRIFAEQTTPTGEIPFFKIGTFGKEPDAYISRSLYDEYRSKYSFPNKGDILLSAAGTLGRTVVYDGKPAYFQDSNIVWLEIDEEQICNEFLHHCYQVMVWASPEGSTISRLYNGIIRDTDILLPPLPEQHRIAAALSDTDALITALEQLIAKKRAVKKGTMQELLTGKRRLPGFEGEWVEKKIHEIGDTSSGGTPSRSVPSYFNGNIPWVTTSELNDNYIRSTVERITSDALNNSSAKLFPKGTVLMAMYGATIGKLGILDVDATTNQACCAMFFNKDIDSIFMYFLLLYHRPEIIEQGSGAGQPNISQTIIKNLTFTIPPTFAEQSAIAEILSDMDIEIDKQSARLKKLRNIKQGMMSELLTGRIRLIEQDATTNSENLDVAGREN